MDLWQLLSAHGTVSPVDKNVINVYTKWRKATKSNLLK